MNASLNSNREGPSTIVPKSPPRRLALIAVTLLLCGAGAGRAAAETPETPAVRQVDLEDPLPYGQSPVDYSGSELDNPISTLQQKLDAGRVSLKHDGTRRGFLLDLLAALDIPLSSQTLVFSKTALNPKIVGPDQPRAVYFNDETYVGWVPDAEAIEVATIDPQKGAVFFLLDQAEDRPARLERNSRCLACHAGRTTLQVPGVLARSFLTDEAGKPVAGYSRVTHETELEKRWGGWYVTGTHGKQAHNGNVIGREGRDRLRRDPLHAGNVTDLSPMFDVARYPTVHSDIVAHLVLNHQTHGQNLIARVSFEERLGRRSDAEDRLLRYLVFADEAPLSSPVRGTSGFRREFEASGKADKSGRSLRQMDLSTRLFRWRLSYLVETRQFRELPSAVRTRLLQRLHTALTGAGEPDLVRHMPPEERRAIIEILKATRPELTRGW